MPRGSKRPGAGAPRHNLNALNTGLHSRQLRAWLPTLCHHPFFRIALLRLLRTHPSSQPAHPLSTAQKIKTIKQRCKTRVH